MEFAVGTFASHPPATFGGVSSTGVEVGDRVAVVDWDGTNPGSTHIVWANVTDITTHKGVFALDINVNLHKGASGGGIFFNGTHIANNWITGRYGVFSWAAINQ